MRDGFGQGGGYLVEGEYGLLAGQDGVGVLAQAVPVLLHRVHLDFHGSRRGRQAGGGVAFDEVVPALLEVVTRVLQQGEGLCLARRGLAGVLGDTLGEHAQLTGVADVLLVIVRLGVEVREVREQQHDGDDQDHEESGDQRRTAHPGKQIACVQSFHYRAPAWTNHSTIPM
ncbi:hypothetical protein D3C76_936880 [compost metagenome]